MVMQNGTRNMNLPLSMSRPIDVDENTPNLEEVQGFPVVGVSAGFHFHQDPITGQMYRMTDEFHDRIPTILANRMAASVSATTSPAIIGGGMTMSGGYGSTPTMVSTSNVSTGIQTNTANILSNPIDYFNFSQRPSPNEPFLRINGESIPTQTLSGQSMSSKFGIDTEYLNMNSNMRLSRLLDVARLYGRGTINNNFTQTSIYYVSPVNKFNNFATSIIPLDTSINRYIPLNTFVGISMGNLNLINNQYTPINKFYNK